MWVRERQPPSCTIAVGSSQCDSTTRNFQRSLKCFMSHMYLWGSLADHPRAVISLACYCLRPEPPVDTTQTQIDDNLQLFNNSGDHFLHSSTKWTLLLNSVNLMMVLRWLYFQILDKIAKASSMLLILQMISSSLPPAVFVCLLESRASRCHEPSRSSRDVWGKMSWSFETLSFLVTGRLRKSI